MPNPYTFRWDSSKGGLWVKVAVKDTKMETWEDILHELDSIKTAIIIGDTEGIHHDLRNVADDAQELEEKDEKRRADEDTIIQAELTGCDKDGNITGPPPGG